MFALELLEVYKKARNLVVLEVLELRTFIMEVLAVELQPQLFLLPFLAQQLLVVVLKAFVEMFQVFLDWSKEFFIQVLIVLVLPKMELLSLLELVQVLYLLTQKYLAQALKLLPQFAVIWSVVVIVLLFLIQDVSQYLA